MSSETSRVVPSTRRPFARRVGRFLCALLAAWGTLLWGDRSSAQAQAQAQAQGGLLIPPGGVVVGKSVRALVLDQIKRVPSGTGRERQSVETRQLLIVDLDGHRLYMAEFDHDEKGHEFLKQHYQVRLDGQQPRIYTLTGDGRYYKEHSEDLNTAQHERNILESNMISVGNRLPTKREREAYFKKHCQIRPDGRRDIDFSLESGERILDRACERLVVKENCLTIIDAQVTSAIPGARNYYHLYRRLGVFSEEVLERLRDLDGVPIKAKINVVTALRTWPLEVETRRMNVRQVPVAFFELPPNAQLIPEETGTGKCPRCGKEFEEEVGVLVVEAGGRKIWFCSEECAVQYSLEPLEQLKKKAQKPSASRGKTAAGLR